MALLQSLSLNKNGNSTSVKIPMKSELFTGQGGCSLLCYITGSLTANVYVSNDPNASPDKTQAEQDSARWILHDTMNAMTTSKSGSIVFPVYAVRLVVSNYSSGSATLDIGVLDDQD